MGTYMDRLMAFWERAATMEEGRQEISQYDQAVDFVITRDGRLVERFQIKAERGRLRFNDQNHLRKQPVREMFVVEVEAKEFERIFSRRETFIDLWYANKVRCLPTMKKDHLIGWVGRIIGLAKRTD